MEYLAKKSFSFSQDCAFTSINSETYTNKWNILQKSPFFFLQDFAFISKSILKNIYRSSYFSLVYFFAKNSFISASKVFYNANFVNM